MVKYPLTGGLDLTTVKPLVQPGSLKECLNFEVSTIGGYTRIGGVERFDGSETVGDFKVWRLKYAGANVFTVGEEAWFDVAKKGRVLLVAAVAGVQVVYVLMPGSVPNPSLPATLTSDSTSATILQREAIFEGFGTQATFNTGLEAIATGQRGRIGQVPGREGADILGGFWFKDRLYAIRDLPRISFEGGLYTDADEGKFITLDGQAYKVLNVRITGDESGILTYDTDAGSGTAVDPIGSPAPTSLPITGDYGPGYTAVPYSDDLDVSGGTAPYTWELSGGTGTALDPVDPPDANAINFVPQLTDAALYRSGSDGWERVDLGREMAFKAGTSAIVNFSRSALAPETAAKDTGYVFCGTATLNGVSNANLAADDGTDAALTGSDDVFLATGFDFSDIPANAVIRGVELRFERHSNAGAEAKDYLVSLLGVGDTANKARGAVWPVSPAIDTYGGDGDLWGSQQITAAKVRDAAFGVRIVATRSNPVNATVGGIDYIQLKVYYSELDQPIYIWDGTTDVPMDLRYAQITGGDPALSTATGHLTVSADVNADKPRLVTVGDEIRTGAAGTGDLLGTVAARDVPIFMPGQSELDNNRARYQFHRTNFYGQDQFEAVYGVSGCGPAFSFDGVRCIRIRTELQPNLDLPRHITRHGDMLVLGYYAGAVAFAKPGDPHEFRGAKGGNVVEIGDRLTALVPLAGDALGLMCQSMSQVIRGTTPSSMVKSPISLNRGGIEYTATDMGRIVLCDGLGIFLADSPESFGAAERSYMSMLVHPWLAPRLQAQANSESAFLRPVAALSVRNKNQMRLYFWDGWVLTMTMNEPVEFTTQRYYTPAEDDHSEPVPWVPRMLASGIDSSGRERLFCSFYGGVKAGYVFELDSGRSFDGEPIPAELVFNPLTVDSSSREKRYDHYHLYGSGYGIASLTASRSVNDGDSFSGSTSFTLGKSSVTAKLKTSPMRGVVDSPVEAFDVSMRLTSESASEGNFTVQFVEWTVDDRGISRGREG